MAEPDLQEIDPFDLPDWLGTATVTWSATRGLRSGARVTGALGAVGEADLACDLLAVDVAHPTPVVPDPVRTRAHQQWQHGQALLLADDDAPVVLAVPGTSFTPERVIETLTRLALAVGADPSRYALHLRLG